MPRGVYKRPSPVERFLPKFKVQDDGCWIWTAASNDGYGRFFYDGKLEQAHRFSYEQFVGTIPSGLEIDHLCRNRACVNPDHLEPVTCAENIRRGDTGIHEKSKTHCPSGHEYTLENTGSHRGKRRCLTCHRERERARKNKKRRKVD